jgi:twinkle protein
MANFERHEPCPNCKSHDALARYSDGSATCFSCKYYEHGDGKTVEETTVEEKDWTPVHGDVQAVPTRGLSEETCKTWGYEVGEYKGKPCHIANYRDEKGRLVGQKIRMGGKKFAFLGAGKNAPLYGQWLWTGGKHLVITEGEIDALSMSQAFDNKWPVVSLPNGAQSAEKAISNAYEWLNSFGRIVLMFDMDEPGQEAAQKVAALLPPGKAAIAVLPEKDANDVLREQGKATLLRAFWDAPMWKPDGIYSGEEFTLDMLKEAANVGYPLDYPKLQERTLGLRKGEITLLTAGSGIGKSTWAKEMAFYLHQKYGCTLGNVFLEENKKKTAQTYIAIYNNVPLGKLRAKPDILADEKWDEALQKVVRQRMYFYDHFGSLESANLLAKLRYLAVVCKVDFIILDHISIVTSGIESSGEGERKDIDILMTRLRSLVEETGVGVIAIVHLKRAQGKTFNEGDQVSLTDLRGSASLEQLSDNVWALERDQQADGPKGVQARIRVLKERETGDTGEADLLEYDRSTGRLQLAPSECPFDEVIENVHEERH